MGESGSHIFRTGVVVVGAGQTLAPIPPGKSQGVKEGEVRAHGVSGEYEVVESSILEDVM